MSGGETPSHPDLVADLKRLVLSHLPLPDALALGVANRDWYTKLDWNFIIENVWKFKYVPIGMRICGQPWHEATSENVRPPWSSSVGYSQLIIYIY